MQPVEGLEPVVEFQVVGQRDSFIEIDSGFVRGRIV
jgi:hypothetical protein